MGIPAIALTLSLLLGTTTALPDQRSVFIEKQDASAVMSRHRRANVGNEETLMPANLERECVEEVCNYEEAREIFQDSYRTDIFWSVYVDGDQCLGNPCKNGAMCSDSVGGYDCVCKSGFSGALCETDQTVCIPDKTKGCSQFCKPGYQSYECSCATGWKVKDKLKDKEKCVPAVAYPCGKVDSLSQWDRRRSANIRSGYEGLSCNAGECPWQALLRNEELNWFCSGVILKENLVLTTAQCATKYSRFHLAVGKRVKEFEEGEQTLQMKKVTPHPLYVEGRPGNDLAVVELSERIAFKRTVLAACLPERDFAEGVLMTGEYDAAVTGWRDAPEGSADVEGSLTLNHLAYEPLAECRARHAGLVTNKMFCTTPRAKADCALGPGSAAVTLYRDVFFLTGVLSRPPGHSCQQGYVFQKVSRFLPWLQPFMA
ncbi:protein Z, vitamin K-dependent plasma glycoprotein a [Anguilla anguilla]|uniref:protein Z, vitamin K-dependent plasma glycoprotein a n=1 Tax=Anguilla anguilla TaxID=7936 RepID=UPI0015B25681|nr:protein Z, vitamin K-dependent plasma glycoprotein a [Anguilla anguilla]XP_035254994.1 protein Z, vitamin K-dependent plasma glycoprotein a [Anguilla anguilla]